MRFTPAVADALPGRLDSEGAHARSWLRTRCTPHRKLPTPSGREVHGPVREDHSSITVAHDRENGKSGLETAALRIDRPRC